MLKNKGFEKLISVYNKFLDFLNPDSGVNITECVRYSNEKRVGQILSTKKWFKNQKIILF